MKLREAKKIANRAIRVLRGAMYLNNWTINLEWRALPDNFQGRITADARYRVAEIEIDNEKHDTEEDLLSTLRHEMAHIYHADFKLFERAVSHLVRDHELNALHEIFAHAQETTVTAIETMLESGLGLTPKRMIAQAERWNR